MGTGYRDVTPSRLPALRPGLTAHPQPLGATQMPVLELSPLSFGSLWFLFLLPSVLLPCSPSSARLGFCSSLTSGYKVTLGSHDAVFGPISLGLYGSSAWQHCSKSFCLLVPGPEKDLHLARCRSLSQPLGLGHRVTSSQPSHGRPSLSASSGPVMWGWGGATSKEQAVVTTLW